LHCVEWGLAKETFYGIKELENLFFLPELIPLVDWVSGVPFVDAEGVVAAEALSTDDDDGCVFFCDKYPFLKSTSCRGVVIFVYSSKGKKRREK